MRPIFYRLSLAEMVVPYAAPESPHSRKFAFDSWVANRFTNTYLIIHTAVNTAWAQWQMSYLWDAIAWDKSITWCDSHVLNWHLWKLTTRMRHSPVLLSHMMAVPPYSRMSSAYTKRMLVCFGSTPIIVPMGGLKLWENGDWWSVWFAHSQITVSQASLRCLNLI